MIRASAIADRYLQTGRSWFSLTKQYTGKVNKMGELGGRPSKYKPEFDKMAYGFGLLGATDAQMADSFGVTEQTLNNWKHDFPSFFESLKSSKLVADAKVAESLYKRAQGFEYDEVTDDEKNGQKTIRKMVPPDPTSMIFWLKNRQPAAWRDKQEVAVDSHNVNENITGLAELIGKPVKNRSIEELTDETKE